MKKLRNKIIVGALVGVIALGGLFQVGGMGSVAHASSARQMQNFIKSQRRSLYLPKPHEKYFGPINSVHYRNLNEFKENVVRLPKGWYMAILDKDSVIFRKN